MRRGNVRPFVFHCSFCERPSTHVHRLIVAPDGVNGICDECADVCVDTFREQEKEAAALEAQADAADMVSDGDTQIDQPAGTPEAQG